MIMSLIHWFIMKHPCPNGGVSIRRGECRSRTSSEISLPTLLLHGEEDVLTSVPASRQFMADLSATDKHITVYPGMYHELFNEPEKEDIIRTCLDWIATRL